MFKVKYVPLLFVFYDRTGIQKFLERQARAGWHLEKTGNYFWKFTRGEAKQVHYGVIYQGKLAPDDPAADARNQILSEFCAASGWELAADNARMQIFRSEEPDPVPIETDALMEVENIHNAAKKSFLFPRLLQLFSAIMLMGTLLHGYREVPLRILLSDGIMAYAGCLVLLLMLGLTDISLYCIWLHRARRSAKQEGTVPPAFGRSIRTALLLALGMMTILFLVSLGARMAAVILLCTVIVAVGTSFIIRGSRRMKEQAYPVFENRTYTVLKVVALALSTALLTGILAGSAGEMEREPGDPPLHLYDLTGEEHDCENCSATIERTLIADKLIVGCGSEDSRLFYNIMDIKVSPAYGICLNYYLQMYDDSIYKKLFGEEFDPDFRQTDPKPWSANAAYHFYYERLGGHMYILCYDRRVVYLSCPQELPAEQMQTVGQILGT